MGDRAGGQLLNPPIQALLFDLDGVITDTAEYHYLAWKQLADEKGIPFDRTENEQLRGVSRRESLLRLLKGRQVDESTMQAWMEQKNSYYQELLHGITPDALLPGVAALLDEARAAGLRLAIVSASRNAPEVVERLGVATAFDALITGGHSGRPKPAPDHFLLAARELRVSPARCIGIEDAAAGIDAIHAAGMVAVGIGPAERLQGAELVLPDTRQMTLERLRYAATWRVREERFVPDDQRHSETVFTIGSGALSTRGTLEERFPRDKQATIMHGLWDDAPIVFTELVNTFDWTSLDLWVNDVPFRMDRGAVHEYSRYLDLRSGELHRHLRWSPQEGVSVLLHFVRIANLAQPHQMAVRLTVTPLEQAVEVRLRARLDGHVENEGLLHWTDFSTHHDEAGHTYLSGCTRATGIELVEGMALRAHGAEEVQRQWVDTPRDPGIDLRAELAAGVEWHVEKLVAARSSRQETEPLRAVEAALDDLTKLGFDGLRNQNREAWESFWSQSNVVIEGDDEAQVGLRHALFQLRIAAPACDEFASIPAKSLSGFGYRGHVFWDTEIFILPFFTYTQPQLARNMLMYRWHTIEGARRKAAAGGFAGAQYAWESAATGDEVTPRWVPGPKGEELVRIWCGDIELHINVDIAFAVVQYWQVTGDDEFMRNYGAAMLLETALFWESRVEPDTPRPGLYSISDVIGPDEYHDHVDNNAFTNRMVAWHLRKAIEIFGWLQAQAPDKADALSQRLDLDDERFAHWHHIADNIVVLQDEESGLIEQFSGFFQRKEVDWDRFSGRSLSMQVLLGIEGANEHQVLKQPDVIMLLTLLEHAYDDRAWRSNWDYYVPRTDHEFGSSLGPAIHAWAACIMGLPEEAYKHFMRAVRADIADVRGNVEDGIHAASAGGVWQAAVFGFAGLRVRDGAHQINPRLPSHWKRLAFTFWLRGKQHAVDLRNE